jgi:hypothetical protein
MTPKPEQNGWLVQECEWTCPSDGAWRVFFYLDGELLTRQLIVAGKARDIELSSMEVAAFNASLL